MLRRAAFASRNASPISCPRTNCRPSNCTARSVAATTVRAPSLPSRPSSVRPEPVEGPGRNFFDIAMAVCERRDSAPSVALSKSARPNWSAVSAIAVSASGTRSSASARRIRARPSALEIGYSLSRLSMAQNGGGCLRTASTQGRATRTAAGQSSASCSDCRRCPTTFCLAAVREGQALGGRCGHGGLAAENRQQRRAVFARRARGGSRASRPPASGRRVLDQRAHAGIAPDHIGRRDRAPRNSGWPARRDSRPRSRRCAPGRGRRGNRRRWCRSA